MRILCLQHVAFETPSTIADWARDRRHGFRSLLMHEGIALPRLAEFDMLVLMGGPMSVHDEAALPWLVDEKRYVARAIAAGKYALGVCLGAQLLAEVLGGSVSKNRWREIGWFPMQRTPGLPPSLANLLPSSLPGFHWHGETFSLPPGAVRVASSAACANQVFAWGDRVLGLQCHLEVTPDDAAELGRACADELVDAPYVQDAATILGQPQRFAAANATLRHLLDEFFPAR